MATPIDQLHITPEASKTTRLIPLNHSPLTGEKHQHLHEREPAISKEVERSEKDITHWSA